MELFGALETGGTWCVVATGTADGEIVDLERFPTEGPDETLARCGGWLRERGPLRRLGVGAFGPIVLDPRAADWGVVTTTPKRGWRGAAVGPRLAREVDVEVVLDTDVSAAALAEHRWGAGRGARSLAYITVGTGVGAGFVIGGRTLRGRQHPEFGHIRVRRHHEADPFAGICPYHGDCLEGLASGPALGARWGVEPATLPHDHPAWALQAAYLADAIATLNYILSPDRVVLGGGVGRRPDLLERVRADLDAALSGYLTAPQLCGPAIEDGLSGVRGALALAIDGPAPA
jgi:fructokinase